MQTELEIIYQDPELVAINKPSGLLVHRSMIDRHETRFALQLVRDMLGQRVYPLHRLDKPTSGVLVFARSEQMARQMMPMFRDQRVEKTYLAIVRGYTEQEGLIDYPLKEQLDRIADADADADKPAQEAVTAYRRLATVELPHAVGRYASVRYSLLALTPHTGRKHQLRRHMKHIFHPILGDTTHGDGRHNRFLRETLKVDRLLLHAGRMEFVSPYSAEPVRIEAGLDPAWQTLLEQFGWQQAMAAF